MKIVKIFIDENYWKSLSDRKLAHQLSFVWKRYKANNIVKCPAEAKISGPLQDLKFLYEEIDDLTEKVAET